jgi:cell filamentation protein
VAREPAEYAARKRAGLDPYVYADSDVLRNRLGIRNQRRLSEVETDLTRERMAEMVHLPMTPKGFDRAHQQIFQDIYDWAGKRRTTGLVKGSDDGRPVLFAPSGYIATGMVKEFDRLAAMRHLKGMSRESFASAAAPFIGEVNVIHPFREGNGGTMRHFLRELARQAGRGLDLARIDPRQWILASHESYKD